MLRRLAILLLLTACTPVPPAAPRPLWVGWSPPAWLDHPDAWVLETLDQAPIETRGPRVRAPAAIVADLDRGEVLWARRADEMRSIASVTKLASALTFVALASPTDLDETHCVTPEMWPIDKGAISRFETGVCHEGWDYLGAALVRSDNRGAMGLSHVAGVPYEDFVTEMEHVVTELGGDASFVDPAGLDPDNRATARDVLRLVVASSLDPLVSTVSSSPLWKIERKRGQTHLRTTNRLFRRWETLAAKTGYTDIAGYCFATVVRSRSNARVAVVVLGGRTAQSRFDDAAALIRWADARRD